ncbi:HD domain-containing protein [Christiangramia aquimixticola]|uniref:HD domain-containing protein n=1 Tax=Christiangramia aquimixticola TaxID=1697558 RepID=UPI003AA80334
MNNREFHKIRDNVLARLESELPPHLTYHDVKHTMEVVENVEFLAELNSLNNKDTILIKIAALYHDSGFIISKDNHEENSCRLATKDLEQLQFPQDVIEFVCEMILATKIPQDANNISQQIIADADLFYLGTDKYNHYAKKLFNELKHFKPEITQLEWLKIQIEFMEQHRFYTQYGQTELAPVKMNHLKRLKVTRDSL